MWTADNVTDADIRRLRSSKVWTSYWERCFAIALREVDAVNDPDDTRANARDRIAEILNASAAKAVR